MYKGIPHLIVFKKADKMENAIIIGIIVVLAVLGLRSTIKHLKGQGECCGGGGYKVKRKKLPKVISQKTFKVEGMKCDNCKNRVEEAVNDIDDLSGRVNLKKGELTVSYAAPVDDEVIISKIERAGYRVVI